MRDRWPPAPLDAEELDGALRPFGRSRMLPAAAYTSAEVLVWERRHLFAGTWSCLGRAEDLFPDGSTQRGVLAGDVPVLLTREPADRAGHPGPAGTPSANPAPTEATSAKPAPTDTNTTPADTAPAEAAAADTAATDTAPAWAHRAELAGAVSSGDLVRAFANTCRHRGHELQPEGGTSGRAAVVCPYHAWAYGLDGDLRTAPRMRDVPGFEPAEHGLVPLPLERWHGWVFVNATGDAAAFDAHLGALAGLVAPYRPEGLRLAARHGYDVAANWKVLVENYHECYHCPQIHPELCAVSPPTSGDNYDLPGAWVGGAMDLREHAETMSFDGRCGGAFLDGVDRRRVLYLALLPDLLLSLHPDYVMAHRLRPLAPGSTRVECSWFVPPGVADAGYAVEFWDRTNRQDWAACESVQRGLASPHFRPGPFAPNEDAVHRWVTLVGRAYRGTPPWTAEALPPGAPTTIAVPGG